MNLAWFCLYICSFFDITKNVPLISGICGAALITVILIAIIACRLTRDSSETEKNPANGTAILTLPKKDGHAIGVEVDMASSYSNNQPTGHSKEWYVWE